MEFETLIKGALELGLIPAIALFLVFSFHRQNVRLTKMLEDREKASMDLVKTFSEHILLITERNRKE
jgi:hypothetical protein